MKKLIKIISVIIACLFVAFIVQRLADKFLISTSYRYMYWRLYNGSRLDQLEIVVNAMVRAEDSEQYKLNQFLINHNPDSVFQKAASVASILASKGDYRYLSFITNVLLDTATDYNKRRLMLYEIAGYPITNRYEWYSQIASRTNDVLSGEVKSMLEDSKNQDHENRGRETLGRVLISNE